MTTTPTVSVIISSYNYARFVGLTIQSVLDQTRPADEIIVVDDGSTDGSLDAIAGYTQHVTLIAKPNGGQATALNAGYARSSGDIVLFLDSDDVLLPNCLDAVTARWTPEYSKIQFEMMIIDENGIEQGIKRPNAPLSRGDLKQQILATGCYTTTPTSGNAFSRHALDRLMPIPADEWKTYADCYLLFQVPFFGQVGAIDTVLGQYRVHASNASALVRNGAINLNVLRSEIDRDIKQQQMLETFCRGQLYVLARSSVLSNWYSVKLRLVSKRLAPEAHPIAGETIPQLGISALRALTKEHHLTWVRRSQFMAWAAAMCVVPRIWCERLAGLAVKAN